MRRRRRRISRLRPPPPLLAVFSVDLLVSLCKNPLQMTMFVLCYWQGARAQWLARVGQTCAVGVVRLMVGGLAFDVPMGRPARSGECSAGHAHVRGDCIQSVACNESKSLVLHSGIPPFAPHALAHALRTVPRSRLSCTPRAARCTLHTLTRIIIFLFFCVAYLCDHASLALVSSTLTQLKSAYEPSRHERFRIRGIRPLVPLFRDGRKRAPERNYLAVSLF